MSSIPDSQPALKLAVICVPEVIQPSTVMGVFAESKRPLLVVVPLETLQVVPAMCVLNLMLLRRTLEGRVKLLLVTFSLENQPLWLPKP